MWKNSIATSLRIHISLGSMTVAFAEWDKMHWTIMYFPYNMTSSNRTAARMWYSVHPILQNATCDDCATSLDDDDLAIGLWTLLLL